MNLFPSIAKMSPADAAAAREALLRYCELDTLAMVKVWEKLKETQNICYMALKITKDLKKITIRLEDAVFTNDSVIKSREFADRDDLVEIVIPEGITRIEKDAFIGCINLKRVILPDSVTEIECWGDEKHAWSNALFSPFSDLPEYLKEGREVDLYPDHWR